MPLLKALCGMQTDCLAIKAANWLTWPSVSRKIVKTGLWRSIGHCIRTIFGRFQLLELVHAITDNDLKQHIAEIIKLEMVDQENLASIIIARDQIHYPLTRLHASELGTGDFRGILDVRSKPKAYGYLTPST